MVETAIIVVPTLWKRKDERKLVMDPWKRKDERELWKRKLAMDPWEQKDVLDHALHKEHYRVKQMLTYEYRKVLYTQYVLEKEVSDDNNGV